MGLDTFIMAFLLGWACGVYARDILIRKLNI